MRWAMPTPITTKRASTRTGAPTVVASRRRRCAADGNTSFSRLRFLFPTVSASGLPNLLGSARSIGQTRPQNFALWAREPSRARCGPPCRTRRLRPRCSPRGPPRPRPGAESRPLPQRTSYVAQRGDELRYMAARYGLSLGSIFACRCAVGHGRGLAGAARGTRSPPPRPRLKRRSCPQSAPSGPTCSCPTKRRRRSVPAAQALPSW
jgi:hypothetical protein